MVRIEYIAHAIGGDVEGNIKKIEDILKRRHTEDVLPLAPYLTILRYLDDGSPLDRKLGMAANSTLFEKGTFDAIRVCSHITKGIFGEIEEGLKLGIPIEPDDEGIKIEVDYAIDSIQRGLFLMRYFFAERTLPNGNILLFHRNEDSEGRYSKDIVLWESEVVMRGGRDVTKFKPTNQYYYEEMFGAAEALEILAERHFPDPNERRAFRQSVYDRIAEVYSEDRMKMPHMRPEVVEFIADMIFNPQK